MKQTRNFHDATENVEIISDGINDYSIELPHTKNLATTGVLSDQETGEVQAKITDEWSRTWSETCIWTLVHSLYANMGRLLYIDSRYASHGGRATHPATAHGIVKKCDEEATCPLKDLVLKKEEIEDKSKADQLLKAIAISHTLWLILNVTTRGITKLPVTQLEIATVAFSLMAVVTYAVNWWKPKDIVTPMTLKIPMSRWDTENDTRSLLSFIKRLIASEVVALDSFLLHTRSRIKNDSVWMQGNTPLIWGLMAISSLIFGGLHCLA